MSWRDSLIAFCLIAAVSLISVSIYLSLPPRRERLPAPWMKDCKRGTTECAGKVHND